MPAAQHEAGTLTPVQAEAKPGKTHDSGIRYPGFFSDRSSPLTKTEDWMQIFELLYRRVSLMMGLHCEKTVNALEVAVFSGVYAKSDGTKVDFAGQAAFAVPDATTDYKLWIASATNTLTGGTSWPADATTYLAIAKVTTAGGVVTEVADARPYNGLRIVPTYSDNGQTAQTVFTINAANVGPDADMDVRFDRGTLLAALRWVAADGRFSLLADSAGGTLAAINLLSLAISGTTMLDADGAAKVAAAVAGSGLAHSAGVLSVGVDGTTIEIDSNALRVKGGAIGWNQAAASVRQASLAIEAGDAAGNVTSGVNVTAQVKDANGDAYAGVCQFGVIACTDADGGTPDTNVALTVSTGSIVRSVAGHDKIVKTNASGQLVVMVTRSTGANVYLLFYPTLKSRRLDCSDTALVDHTQVH